MNRSFQSLTFTLICAGSFVCTAYAQDQTQNSTQLAKTGSVEKKAALLPGQNNAVVVDDKITDEEKRQYNAAVDEANKYNEQQAAAVNRIPGVEVQPEDLKQKKKEGFSLNPIKWIFGPVIRLQEQSVTLEQQIMKLTGPIAALQPGMLKLENRMNSMQQQLTHVEKTTGSVEGELQSIRKDIASMHRTLSEIKKPVTDIKGPIMSLRQPIMNIAKPITGVDKDLTEVKTLLSLILTAIFITALLISIGTPVAAILVWRNRHKLLPPPDAKQQREEERIKQATKTMDHQLKA